MKKLSKGMFKDTARVDQPEGTMRDALNANINIKKGSISNEWGTTEYPTNANFRVLGRAVLDDDRIVMFGQQVEGEVLTDQIRVLDTRNQQTIILYQNNALNFQQTHPIVTTHRKNQAGDYLVYFTDGYQVEEEIYDNFDYVTDYNPPRVINVTKQLEWLAGPGAITTLYNNLNSVNKLQLVPRVGLHSTFANAEVIEGGALPCAAYYLALAYADQDGLETNYFVLSNPLYISPKPENTLPTNSFIGAEGGTPTSKAIRWTIDVPIGIDYELMQPAVLKLQKTALTAVKIAPVLLNQGNQIEIVYSGTEDVAEIATDDIIVDNVNYITADTINQLDNRLYLGNVSSNKDIGFQPFAHNIRLDTVIDTIPDFNPRLYDTFILNHGYTKLLQDFRREQGQQWGEDFTFNAATGYQGTGVITDDYADLLRNYMTYPDGRTRKGYRSPEFSFNRKTYRRGEVYAFYISFVLNDGTETYAYHIPGRQALCMDYSAGFPVFQYESAYWRKVTWTAVPVQNGPFTQTLTFETIFVEVIDVDGYTNGLYRYTDQGVNGSFTGSDGVQVDQFDAGGAGLPTTVSLNSGPGQPAGFVAESVTSGGTFGDGNNALQLWLESFGPSLLSPVGFEVDEIVGNEFLDVEVSILETGQEIILGEEEGQMCENDIMSQFSNEANRAAHGFRPEEMLEQNNDLRVYQVVDTTPKVFGQTTGFWENVNETYPNTPDFLQGTVTTEGAVEFPGDTLANQNVRHHKMPSNLGDLGFMQRVDVGGPNYAEFARNPNTGNFINSTTTLDATNNAGIITSETVNILGIRLSNIQIPREILGQVQGYKIYYAKREQKDKSVLGQSLAMPGHPRYGASPHQNLEQAVAGPFVKAFYMYGGLDHTDGSTIDTMGKWKGPFESVNSNTVRTQRYLAHPVFKFHDFNMLRKRVDLSSVTHVQCQYGVMFRQYSGGPGVFVPACTYDKLWDAPRNYDMDNLNDFQNDNYLIPNSEESNLKLHQAHATSFPSMGWVSPELRNTVDFYWHDPRYEDSDDGGINNKVNKGLFGSSRILDISDESEGEINIIFRDAAIGANFKTTDTSQDNAKDGAKRARKYRKGVDLQQPAEDDNLGGKVEKVLAIKAKEGRVRGWWTSTMVATSYISPRITISSRFIIKGGDYKIPYYGIGLNLFYDEGNFDDNQFTFAVEPGGKILLHGKDDHISKDAAAFKGVNMLFNRSGETAHAFSLISGLPALRGHAPFYSGNPGLIYETGVRAGLVRWGEATNFLYPDVAAVEGLPLLFQQFGRGTDPGSFWTNNSNGEPYSPKDYRGLRYTMDAVNNFYGLPMAWLVNVCATKTDVFNPFDKQQLVWTGYYQPINDVNLDNGAANDGDGNTTNYYIGGDSDDIYGGDTYINKYSFRTTSQSYGHAFFRADRYLGDPRADAIGQDPINDTGLKDYMNQGVLTTKKRRFQTAIPANLDPTTGAVASAAGNGFGTTNGFPIWNYNPFAAISASNSDNAFDVQPKVLDILQDSRNWVKGNVNPVSTVFTFMCESDDLIEFRHVDDVERGEDTLFFDYNTAHRTIFESPAMDLTHPDKMLYEDHYSALQNKKVTSPLPVFGELSKVQTFPNRVVRSDVDSGSLADGYRKFRALEFKDIPSHRGDIRNLFDLGGNLYIHTERSLFVTKGKEELQLSAVTAFIGSGNIFVQDPDEVMQSDAGHAGTTSRHAHVTTPYGHFYTNYRDKKVYNVSGQGIQDVTNGMETWLRDNMPFIVEEYGINLESLDAENNGFFVDATTGQNVPLGFTLGYDPLFKRVLITKHEPIPTQQFLEDFYAGNIVIQNNIPYLIADCIDGTSIPDFEAGRVGFRPDTQVFCGPIWFGNPVYFTQGGWTVSYYPEMKVWGSRHSYRPNLYTNTSEFLVSFANDRSWEHTNKENPGRFYGQLYNFEVEYVDNTAAGEAKLYSNMFYWAESFLPDQNSVSESFRISNPVFDEFYAYNSTQITGLPTTINYLNNARLVDRIWYVNEIRDLSQQQELLDGALITGTENVAGNITTSVTVHPQAVTMFTEEGVVNNNYVNPNKEWFNRRKMIDHYLGVRLIKDNTNRNLVHLYAVGTKFRKSFR